MLLKVASNACGFSEGRAWSDDGIEFAIVEWPGPRAPLPDILIVLCARPDGLDALAERVRTNARRAVLWVVCEFPDSARAMFPEAHASHPNDGLELAWATRDLETKRRAWSTPTLFTDRAWCHACFAPHTGRGSFAATCGHCFHEGCLAALAHSDCTACSLGGNPRA